MATLCNSPKISMSSVYSAIKNGAGVRICYRDVNGCITEYYAQRDPSEKEVVFNDYDSDTDEDNDVDEIANTSWQDEFRNIWIPLLGNSVSSEDVLQIHNKFLSWKEFENVLRSATSIFVAPYWEGPYEPPLTTYQRAALQAKANAVVFGLSENEKIVV